jgi:hypothetical protein
MWNEIGDELLHGHALLWATEVLGTGNEAETAKIEPGTKASALAGDDDDPTVVIGVDRVESLMKLPHQVVGQCVESFRAIECELGDVRFRMCDLDVGHRSIVGSVLAPLKSARGNFCCLASGKHSLDMERGRPVFDIEDVSPVDVGTVHKAMFGQLIDAVRLDQVLEHRLVSAPDHRGELIDHFDEVVPSLDHSLVVKRYIVLGFFVADLAEA